MIKVEGLSKRFGDTYAVFNLSFEVEKGEIVGFLGPNGAGKTTTMRILTGYLPPTEGRAVIAGHDVFYEPIEVKRKVGYLPEHPPLYLDMIVKSYLWFVAELKGIPRSNRAAEVGKVLEQCDLEHVSGRITGNLSKGYRQRVGLAQALIGDPEILILDEPTIGLDPNQIIEIREIIKGLAGERTIILSTHILPEVAMTCSRVLIINKGKLAAEDTLEHLSRSQHLSVILSKPPANAVAEFKAMTGVHNAVQKQGNCFELEINLEDKTLPEKIAEKIVKSGWGLRELKQESTTLEDVFIKHTTGEAAQQAVTISTIKSNSDNKASDDNEDQKELS